jgi:hypothetical protein
MAGKLLTHNAFTYCYNNPVSMQDDSGYWPTLNDVGNFALGVVSGFDESITYGTSRLIEPDNDSSAYMVGKIAGNLGGGIVGVVGFIGSGGFAVLTSPTGVGAIAGAAGATYCRGVAVSGVTNAAANMTILMANMNSNSGSKYSLKPFKNNKEANKVAQKLGYGGAEELKHDFVGNQGSKFNNKYDSFTGELILESIKDSIQVPTGLFK